MSEDMAEDYAETLALVSNQPVDRRDISMLRQGQKPEKIRDMVNRYRSQIGLMPFNEVVPDNDPQKGARALEAVMNDEGEAVKVSFLEAARTQPLAEADEWIQAIESMYQEQRQIKAHLSEATSSHKEALEREWLRAAQISDVEARVGFGEFSGDINHDFNIRIGPGAAASIIESPAVAEATQEQVGEGPARLGSVEVPLGQLAMEFTPRTMFDTRSTM